MEEVKEINELDLLKEELSKVSSLANDFNISHTYVAKENNISYDYLRLMRKGYRPSVNSKKNRALIRSIIESYRKQIRKKQEKLNSINVYE